MICQMEKQITILPSICDNTSRLSIPSIFLIFMDIASEHAPMLGVGGEELMKKNLFWLTVKTKIKIYERPKMLDKITAKTWPEAPERIRCIRYYSLSDGNQVLAEGKSEWTVIGIDDGKLHRPNEIYPTDLVHSEEKVCAEPFARLSEDFSDGEEIGIYKVRSTDIDLGQHMNNAAYVRAIFGMFTCKKIEEMNITEAEIAFKSPSFEGEELSVKIRRNEGYIDIGMIKESGKAAVVARLTMKDEI